MIQRYLNYYLGSKCYLTLPSLDVDENDVGQDDQILNDEVILIFGVADQNDEMCDSFWKTSLCFGISQQDIISTIIHNEFYFTFFKSFILFHWWLPTTC